MDSIGSRYATIQENIKRLAERHGRHPADIQLIAVTKTQPPEAIEQAYKAGCRLMGESRVQEALEKIPLLPDDIVWHLIGTLQSNKASKIFPAFSLIHSVDTPELAKKISEISEKKEAKASILLQVNVSEERSKHGLSSEEWRAQLKVVDRLPHLRLEGLMTIAPLSQDKQMVQRCFEQLRLLRDDLRQEVKHPEIFRHLSMGMSQDYPLAIAEGATLLRIGSAIFGIR